MATIYHLGIKKGSTTWTVPIYDNTAEAGSAHSYIKYGGKSGYIPLCSTSDSRATGGRVKEHNGNEWAISISGAPPYTKKTYSNPGTYSFTVPAGVTKLRCEIAGAGGGGGSGKFWYAANTGYTEGSAGGKGGNGNKWNGTFTVSPGNTITITVGSGGAGGSKPKVNLSNNGSSGGSSSCNGTTSGGGKGGQGGKNRKAGEAGANSGNGKGGAGGAGGAGDSGAAGAGSRGNNGWVIIEYGMGVQ